MEIALLPKSVLRIKSKRATFAIDPQDKSAYEAILLLNKPRTNDLELESSSKHNTVARGKSIDEVTKGENTVIIGGHGEYEIGGIKMTGTRVHEGMIYSMNVDGVDILLGNLSALDKAHGKLQEHNIVIANCIETGNASFITSLSENVIMFYGEKGAEVASGFGKESVKTMNKYSSTKDKLPAEVETILLQ